MTAKKIRPQVTPKADKRDEQIKQLQETLVSVDNERQRFQREVQSAQDRIKNYEGERKLLNELKNRTRKMHIILTNGENIDVEYTFKTCRGWWFFMQTNGNSLRLNPANIAYMEERANR